MKIELEIFKFSEKMPENLSFIILFRNDGDQFIGQFDEHDYDRDIEYRDDYGYYVTLCECECSIEVNLDSDAWAYAPKLSLKGY